MITQTGIRRPTIDEPYIGLGTLVSYHHCCCEMRLPRDVNRRRREGESPIWVTVGKASPPPHEIWDWDGKWIVGDASKGPFQLVDVVESGTPFRVSDARVNKTLAIWPQKGEYVVKHSLEGIDRGLAFVPMDAAKPINKEGR